MVKNVFCFFCVAILLFLSGCAGLDHKENQDDQGLSRMQDPVRDVTYNGPPKNIQNNSPSENARGEFGHTHYSRKPGRDHALDVQHIPKTDYQALSDIITRVELSLPDIYDVGTLVTDQYVLIAYKTTNDNRVEAAEQVKRTALSVVPNYYKVYVSDERFAQTDIANFKNLDVSTPRVHQWLENLIKQMKQSPQGTTSPKTHQRR